MSVVAIYLFSGQYQGNPEYDYDHPAQDATHQCMLFLRQDGDDDQYEEAEAECLKYGFQEIQFHRRGILRVDMLNTDAFRGFSGFYEDALELGSALVYYPN